MFSWIERGLVNLKKRYDGKPDLLDWPLLISIVVPCALFLFAAISPLINHLPDLICDYLMALLDSMVYWYFNLSPVIKGCFALASVGILLFILIRRFQVWNEKLSIDDPKSTCSTARLWADVKLRFLVYMKIDQDHVRTWQHIYYIDENKSFQNNWSFWVWLVMPFAAAIILAWWGFPKGVPLGLNMSPDGYENFVTYFKFPMGVLSLMIVTGVMIARMHGSKQRDSMIKNSEAMNDFDRRFKHKDEFLLYVAGMKDDIKVAQLPDLWITSKIEPINFTHALFFPRNSRFGGDFDLTVDHATLWYEIARVLREVERRFKKTKNPSMPTIEEGITSDIICEECRSAMSYIEDNLKIVIGIKDKAVFGNIIDAKTLNYPFIQINRLPLTVFHECLRSMVKVIARSAHFLLDDDFTLENQLLGIIEDYMPIYNEFRLNEKIINSKIKSIGTRGHVTFINETK